MLSVTDLKDWAQISQKEASFSFEKDATLEIFANRKDANFSDSSISDFQSLIEPQTVLITPLITLIRSLNYDPVTFFDEFRRNRPAAAACLRPSQCPARPAATAVAPTVAPTAETAAAAAAQPD